ncbi:alpha/beta hydrolase [Pseudomonas sp. CCI3.2]|uniref:alpha/beta hydrolase n=1 Tax=unclassified Pseudomonas TaxID=196821 RepID=UPI002AC93601|nr:MULTISPECIES: alpha/beta hydrolase [unclassified Pseudomonas]MEB0079923.1 alpha/beta hydrolase [Pseudomonas sp. MH10out]MEB0093367.1 alpha/beta hydrolase [Pseudomonas sp. CCI4.2]MEB0104595.1 alpha/beta hydrolase [Pseudomonas sp. CCI3.2]MEB0130518.1 alpha/beta hydrolase [Pseudomonas sp. CCI2.4]MEB0156830.1 alpha/beta hydrolase [Pseudomonas sp. AH2 (2023)]
MTSNVFKAMLTGLLAAVLAACSPVNLINALTPGSTFTRVSDIAYGDDPRNKLDVYTPAQAPTNAPVVVFFYGGSWNSGSRIDYKFVGEALASRGIVVVIADYRLYPQVRYPTFLEDSARAVAWAYQHAHEYGGDPQNLYVMGHSSGAYNAAMIALDPAFLEKVGLKPSILRGWIGLAGPYDFLPIDNEDVKPVFFFPNSPPDSQPINHVSRDSPPALLIASKDDKVVNPTRNTGGLAARLRADGVPVRELYFSRTGHATLVAAMSRPLRALAPVLDDVVDFIHADLRAQPVATQ